ncbi:hypothetical protein NESM_000090400 [Novymonas esmeraldas]|uniref:Cation/H+ exchanger domain-containing protein n=1 Tax=Novymonas esmeraldas TaxID=1808958 RepID=A0AAW0F2L6_9TRYP
MPSSTDGKRKSSSVEPVVFGVDVTSTSDPREAESSPYLMLYQSIANPVSDDRIMEDEARRALGRELLCRTLSTAVYADPAAGETRDAVQLGSGEELRDCEDAATLYIFRTDIRAPPGVRPAPYLVKEPACTGATTTTTAAAPAASPECATAPSPPAAPEAGAFRELTESAHISRSPLSSVPDTSPTVSPRDARRAREPASAEDGAVAEERQQLVAGARPHNTYFRTGAFYATPISAADVAAEKAIVDALNALSSEERRMEMLEALSAAYTQPRAGASGANDWDDTTEEVVHRWFDLEVDVARCCCYVTLFRRRFCVFIVSYVLRCFCLFLFWVIMFSLIPENWFSPGGLYFDALATIVFSGIVGTAVARLLTIPSPVGVMCAGILWNNVPYTGRLTSGITLSLRQFVAMVGLTIGLIRAGLSLNVIRFKQKFKHYLAFSLLPMLAEALVHGVCCKYIYGYPNYRWALAEGFLLSSVAAGVVVPPLIAYQHKGYGARDGPPMMMLCSVAIDTAVCVWAVQLLLSLEFELASRVQVIVLAPMQLVAGLVGGVLLGALVFAVTFYILFIEGEPLPGRRGGHALTMQHSVHVRYLALSFLVLVSLAGVSVGYRFYCVGGASIGVLAITGTFNYLCLRGGTADHLRMKADMVQTLTTVSSYIAMPALFGLSGASVDVSDLFARDFIGLAFGLVFIGIGARCLCAMAVPHLTGLRLSWSETLFCGLGWIGKGTVQGALGPFAEVFAAFEVLESSTSGEEASAWQRVEWGHKMKNTAVLGILVASPICSIFLSRFTPRLLKPGT